MKGLKNSIRFGVASLVVALTFTAIFSRASLADYQELTYKTADGTELKYVIAAPNLQGTHRYPLWIFQPGDGSILDTFDPTQFEPMMVSFTQAFGIALIMPELRRELYTNDLKKYCELDFFHRVGDLSSLIDAAKVLPSVDTAKIILFGHSAGGEIVTRTAAERSDIWGVATYGTGVVSDSEIPISPPIPPDYFSNDCTDPARYKERSGTFWHQLFNESNLNATIRSLPVPYLAMFGGADLVMPFDDHETRFANALIKTKPNFSSQIFPGLDHGGFAEGPAVFQRIKAWSQ